MATFEEHIRQAKSNLSFLESVSSSIPRYWDWKITVSFYASLHLVNAHIKSRTDQHYRSHEQVAFAINPNNQLSPAQVPEDIFLSYKKLQNLSRRARYLVHDNTNNHDTQAHFTYDRHLSKTLTHLDNLLIFFANTYGTTFEKLSVDCPGIEKKDLKNFRRTV